MTIGGCSPGSEPAREQRFRAMHEQTYADLLRFVERRIPANDAEDVVATVYLTAWRRLDDVPADARPWLFGVARNTMANQTRSWARQHALDVRLAGGDHRVEPDGSAGAADRIDLARAWRTLSAADREVLALVAFDGLNTEQAARVLGCRPTAFSTRLSRARRRLQAALDTTTSRPAAAPTARQQMKEHQA